MHKWICISALALGMAAAADRPDLTGKWLLDTARSQLGQEPPKAETLSIVQKEDSIQISDDVTEADGKEKKLDLSCNTIGKECKTKEAQVSFYFNGPRLIMIEMRHGNDVVIKKRLQPSDDGKTLNVEVMHIAPPGEKNETYTFTRQ